MGNTPRRRCGYLRGVPASVVALFVLLAVPVTTRAGSIPNTACSLVTTDGLGFVQTGMGHVSKNGNRISGSCVGYLDPGPVTLTGTSTGFLYGCGGADFLTYNWTETVDRHGRATLVCRFP